MKRSAASLPAARDPTVTIGMPRWLMFLLFFGVALLILGSVHYYFYRRLFVAPVLPPPWPKVGAIALGVATLSFPVSFVLARTLAISSARFVLYPIYVWLGVMMMLFFALVSLDLARGVVWLGTRLAGHEDLLADPGRRKAVARLLAGAAATTVLTASGLALGRGLGKLVVKRIDVLLDKLPAELDGFTIAQLTDLHLGAMRHGAWVDDVVRETNRLAPDLIAITGDLADATPQQLRREIAALERLTAKHGIFFVTGNHEYFIDLAGWLQTLQSMGIRVLRNERVRIDRGGAHFHLVGVDDHDGGRMAPGHGPDLARAMLGIHPDSATVLLAHQPRAIFDAAEQQIGLVLSGHTHGGQIWPWNYLVYLQQPYVSGLHQHGGTQIYVSEGTGFWGPPMRLGSTAEITLVTLRSPAAATHG